MLFLSLPTKQLPGKEIQKLLSNDVKSYAEQTVCIPYNKNNRHWANNACSMLKCH